MGCDLTAVSVGVGDAPVCIDGDDAGESKEYGLDSDHYACWLRISRVQHEILVSDIPRDCFTVGCEVEYGIGCMWMELDWPFI